MLAVQTTAYKRDRKCDCCGKNIPAGQYCIKVTSDVDHGKYAVIDIGCFTYVGSLMAERIDAMVAKHFPNESRTRKEQDAILKKVSKRKESK